MAAVPAPHPMRSGAQRVLGLGTSVDLGVLRVAGAGMLGLGLLLPHLHGRPQLPCPLRAATGVPCPFCGLSTSVESILRLRPGAAAAANPFGFVAVALAALILILPRWRRALVPTGLLVAGVAASWVFELHRYHVV